MPTSLMTDDRCQGREALRYEGMTQVADRPFDLYMGDGRLVCAKAPRWVPPHSVKRRPATRCAAFSSTTTSAVFGSVANIRRVTRS